MKRAVFRVVLLVIAGLVFCACESGSGWEGRYVLLGDGKRLGDADAAGRWQWASGWWIRKARRCVGKSARARYGCTSRVAVC